MSRFLSEFVVWILFDSISRYLITDKLSERRVFSWFTFLPEVCEYWKKFWICVVNIDVSRGFGQIESDLFFLRCSRHGMFVANLRNKSLTRCSLGPILCSFPPSRYDMKNFCGRGGNEKKLAGAYIREFRTETCLEKTQFEFQTLKTTASTTNQGLLLFVENNQHQTGLFLDHILSIRIMHYVLYSIIYTTFRNSVSKISLVWKLSQLKFQFWTRSKNQLVFLEKTAVTTNWYTIGQLRYESWSSINQAAVQPTMNFNSIIFEQHHLLKPLMSPADKSNKYTSVFGLFFQISFIQTTCWERPWTGVVDPKWK